MLANIYAISHLLAVSPAPLLFVRNDIFISVLLSQSLPRLWPRRTRTEMEVAASLVNEALDNQLKG